MDQWNCFDLILLFLLRSILILLHNLCVAVASLLTIGRWNLILNWDTQKQPPEVFCKIRCSQKFRKIHRKKPVLESLFKEKCRPATLLKKRLWSRWFPVNFVKFLRTPFLQNISGRLVLDTGNNLSCYHYWRRWR